MSTRTVQPAARPWQLNLFWIFSLAGAMLIMLAFLIGLFVLTPTAQDYWGNHSKLARDCAGVSLGIDTGFDATNNLVARCETEGLDVDGLQSALGSQIITLTSTTRWLEPLIFVGIAAFMVGIALEFSSIPKLLKNRADVMSAAYTQLIKQ